MLAVLGHMQHATHSASHLWRHRLQNWHVYDNRLALQVVSSIWTPCIAHQSGKTVELRPFHHLPFTFAAYEQVVLQRITWACWTQTWGSLNLRIVFLCVCTQVLCWYFARVYLFMCSRMVQGSAGVLVTITDAVDNLIGSEETRECK